ncbi:MAG: tetratricopeptide repeat protein [Sulfolobaceae archaeon]|nr:tetratricopeptide repeat protein [Sulfolobaceae archaeon]
MDELEEVIKAYNEGNLNYALKKLKEIIDKNQSSTKAYNLLGKILEELGNDDEALKSFEKAGNKLEMARIYIQHGLYRDALELLKDLNSDDARLLRALAYLKLEEIEKAKEEITNLTANSPILLKVKGIIDYKTGNYLDALRELTLAIRSYPYDAELYYYRALTKEELNLDAEEDINTAINLNPYYAELYFEKGILLEKKGMIKEAVNYYSKAINYKPQFVKAYYRRAKAYMKLGKEEEAMKDIEKVKSLNADKS